MKKKVLLSSILTIALCLSLIAGSTFALFTSESSVNIAVTAGKVDVQATLEDISLYSPKSISANGNVIDADNGANTANNTFKNGGTALFTGGNTLTLDRVTPGDSVTATIKLTNNSNVSIQYRTIIKGGEGDNALLNGLKVTFGEGESAQSFTGNTIKSAWTAFDGETKTIQVTIELPATAGNEYQEKSCNLIFTVEAVQGNAQMPDEWDGSSVTPDLSANEVHITTAAQFAYLMEQTSAGNTNSWNYDKTFILDCDIDFGGATITGIGSDHDNISFTFDGNSHTISNFVIDNSSRDNYAGLFNRVSHGGKIKNLTVANATIRGNGLVGAIASSLNEGSSIENCKVYNCTLIGKDQVGAVVGGIFNDSSASAVSNCYAENCNVIYTVGTYQNTTNRVIGYLGEGTTDSNNSYDNVTISKADYVISTAEEFVEMITTIKGGNNGPYTNKSVVLTRDIDLGGATIVTTAEQGNRTADGLKFDALGHTVSNFTIDSTANPVGYYGGLFGYLAGWNESYIKNLTVRNATIIGGKQTGVIVGGVNNMNSSVENCKVYDCTIIGTKKVGAVVGYTANGIVKDCYAENCNVYCAENDANECGEVIGFINTVDPGCTDRTSNNTSLNVNVRYGMAVSAVSNAADLSSALQRGGNILLLNDISVTEWTSVTVGTSSVYQPVGSAIAIDGGGHSISGLTAPLLAANATTNSITIENMTIKDSIIDNSQATDNNMNCGAFIAYRDNAGTSALTLKNCHVVDSSIIAHSDKNAGALVGYLSCGN